WHEKISCLLRYSSKAGRRLLRGGDVLRRGADVCPSPLTLPAPTRLRAPHQEPGNGEDRKHDGGDCPGHLDRRAGNGSAVQREQEVAAPLAPEPVVGVRIGKRLPGVLIKERPRASPQAFALLHLDPIGIVRRSRKLQPYPFKSLGAVEQPGMMQERIRRKRRAAVRVTGPRLGRRLQRNAEGPQCRALNRGEGAIEA